MTEYIAKHSVLEAIEKRSTQNGTEPGFHSEVADLLIQDVKAMPAMDAIHLHETDGFGAVRLRRCLDPFVADWMRLMRIYLHKDKAGLAAEMRRMLDRYNACPLFRDEFTL